jgi:hypothetical protein
MPHVWVQVMTRQRPSLQSATQPPGTDLALPPSDQALLPADAPASFSALPEFTALIEACWSDRDLERPSAQELHTRLQGLLDGRCRVPRC